MAQSSNNKNPMKQPNRSSIVTMVVFIAIGIFFMVMMNSCRPSSRAA